MKARILWIEDDACGYAANFAVPIYTCGKYDLEIAFNASEGFHALTEAEKVFDAVIVDIRLPSGDDPRWKSLFRKSGSSETDARLGVQLMESAFKHPDAKILSNGSNHFDPNKFGVFTIESKTEILHDLDRLGIGERFVKEKTAELPVTALRELIDDIICTNGNSHTENSQVSKE